MSFGLGWGGGLRRRKGRVSEEKEEEEEERLWVLRREGREVVR